jgi:putative peptidoglycan lipid II flippase
LRSTLGLGVLAAGALAALADPVVQLVYGYGRFGAEDTQAVASLLVVLCAAIPAWVVQQVAVRGFYARGEMWLAMTLSTGIALGVFPLYWIGGEREGVLGLAWASTTAITLNALLTLIWLHVRAATPAPLALLETLSRSVGVVVLAALPTVFALAWIRPVVPWPIGQVAAGGAVYGVAALIAIPRVGDGPLQEGLTAVLARVSSRLPGRGPKPGAGDGA